MSSWPVERHGTLQRPARVLPFSAPDPGEYDKGREGGCESASQNLLPRLCY